MLACACGGIVEIGILAGGLTCAVGVHEWLSAYLRHRKIKRIPSAENLTHVDRRSLVGCNRREYKNSIEGGEAANGMAKTSKDFLDQHAQRIQEGQPQQS